MLPWLAAALAIGGLGAWLVQDLTGFSSIAWMNIYRVEDFPDLDAVQRFFADLRIAIPPWLAAIEFAEHLLGGAGTIVPVHLYRIALVASYVLALWLTYPSLTRLAIALPLGVVFLWATTLIHPAGPNVYDAVYPCLILAYLLALRFAARSWLAAILAGLALSLAELTRPFVLLLLPLLLLAPLPMLLAGARPRLRALLFVLPVLVLSGGWHAFLLVKHGQVTWTNHSGFNLQRAWTMVEPPALLPEAPPAKLAPDRLDNFNTDVHGENSRRLQQAIFAYIASHPVQSAVHVAERLAALVSGEVTLHGQVPDGPVISIYQVVVKYPALWIFAAAAGIVLAILLNPGGLAVLLADTGNILILSTAATLAIMAVTESGEEARFLIAVLPCLAAVPVPRLSTEPRSARAGQARRGWRWALAILAILAIELFAQGSQRRVPEAAEGPGTSFPPRDETQGPIRLGLLHVRGGRWKDRARDGEAIARCLQGLDVIGLNGVNGRRPFSTQPDQAETLARLTGTVAIFAPTERRWWSDWYGNALLSHITVSRWRREPLPAPRTPPKRNTLAATIELDQRKLQVMVTQVDFGYDREAQLSLAIARFRALPEPAVLMGELNATTDLAAFRDLLATPGVQFVTTDMPTAVGTRPVDWIVARGLRLENPRFCDTGVSDHPAILVEIKPLS